MTSHHLSAYNPTANYEVKVSDVEYLRHGTEPLLATVYQPQGSGPFPALLTVHGGAWNGGSRSRSATVETALAASGAVVVSIDFRVAPQHPYPAQVADAHYATRWLKAHAAHFSVDPQTIGAMGYSSGGHTVMLNAMRPQDPRYAAIPLPEAPYTDASVSCVIARYPVLDPWARYLYAQEAGVERLVASTRAYFLTEEAMKEGNPQHILDRGESVPMSPVLVIQGTADANVPISVPERFTESYRAAGGQVDFLRLPNVPHLFDVDPSPVTSQAIGAMKEFLAKHLAPQHVKQQ